MTARVESPVTVQSEALRVPVSSDRLNVTAVVVRLVVMAPVISGAMAGAVYAASSLGGSGRLTGFGETALSVIVAGIVIMYMPVDAAFCVSRRITSGAGPADAVTVPSAGAISHVPAFLTGSLNVTSMMRGATKEAKSGTGMTPSDAVTCSAPGVEAMALSASSASELAPGPIGAMYETGGVAPPRSADATVSTSSSVADASESAFAPEALCEPSDMEEAMAPLTSHSTAAVVPVTSSESVTATDVSDSVSAERTYGAIPSDAPTGVSRRILPPAERRPPCRGIAGLLMLYVISGVESDPSRPSCVMSSIVCVPAGTVATTSSAAPGLVSAVAAATLAPAELRTATEDTSLLAPPSSTAQSSMSSVPVSAALPKSTSVSVRLRVVAENGAL